MIIVVGGPAGSGKTTVATYLSQELGIPYLEGDDYHSTANKIKMGNGISLTDADRWDWLITVRNEAMRQLQGSRAVIVTCSVLRRKFRDVLRIASYWHPTLQVRFIYLKADEAHLRARVKARIGHYMKENMVRSQMETLEEPAQDEFDVIRVDVQHDEDIVRKKTLAGVRAILKEYEFPLRPTVVTPSDGYRSS